MTSGSVPRGVYEDDDGNWYGVAPSETGDDEPKYDLNDCNDVRDAYNLRNNGDYDIATETLVARIKRVSDHLECPTEFTPWTDSSIAMTDAFELDELRTAVIVDEHDGIAELIDEKDSRIEELEDSVETYESDIEAKEDHIDELESRLREEATDRLEEKAAALAELSDSVDAEQFVVDEDDDLADVEATIDEVEQLIDVAEGASSEVATPPTETGDNQTDSADEQSDDGRFDLRQQTA